jgi:hypothetical protein
VSEPGPEADPRAALAESVTRLAESVDSAGVRLRTRSEWKKAQTVLLRLRAGGPAAGLPDDAATDLRREAEAAFDLLGLARDELLQTEDAEAAFKRQRLADDEKLLAFLEGEAKQWLRMVGLAYILPALLIFPVGRLVIFCVAPLLIGYPRVRKALSAIEGRAWLLQRSRIDEIVARIRRLNLAALGAAVMLLLWFAFAWLWAAMPPR